MKTNSCPNKIDKRSGIVNDPNRADDPQYILRLIGKVVSVSLEKVRAVDGLPELGTNEGVSDRGSVLMGEKEEILGVPTNS